MAAEVALASPRLGLPPAQVGHQQRILDSLGLQQWQHACTCRLAAVPIKCRNLMSLALIAWGADGVATAMAVWWRWVEVPLRNIWRHLQVKFAFCGQDKGVSAEVFRGLAMQQQADRLWPC
jgi:hypothetical protein